MCDKIKSIFFFEFSSATIMGVADTVETSRI